MEKSRHKIRILNTTPVSFALMPIVMDMSLIHLKTVPHGTAWQRILNSSQGLTLAINAWQFQFETMEKWGTLFTNEQGRFRTEQEAHEVMSAAVRTCNGSVESSVSLAEAKENVVHVFFSFDASLQKGAIKAGGDNWKKRDEINDRGTKSWYRLLKYYEITDF